MKYVSSKMMGELWESSRSFRIALKNIFFFWPCCKVCGILVPSSESKS